MTSSVPHIYWINLARSVARRERMQTALNSRNLSHTRIEGIDGNQPGVINRHIRCAAESPAIAGCLVSHLIAIRTAYLDGRDFALFLEDDTSFELYDEHPKEIHKLLDKLPPNWSGLWLAYGDKPQRLHKVFLQNQDLLALPTDTIWGGMAYVLHKRAMKYLCDQYWHDDIFDVRNFPDRHESDTVLLRSLSRAPGLSKPYLLRIPMFVNDGIDSETHESRLLLQNRSRQYTIDSFPKLLAGKYAARTTFISPIISDLRLWLGRWI